MTGRTRPPSIASRRIRAWVLAATAVPGGVSAAQEMEAVASPAKVPQWAPVIEPQDELDGLIRDAAARRSFDVSGDGLAVAVIDTGVNPHHRAFAGRLLPGRSFSGGVDPSDTADDNGHGSHNAALIAGGDLGVGRPDAAAVARQVAGELFGVGPGRESVGVAPGAKIVPLKVYPEARVARMNEALRWVLDDRNRDDYFRSHGVLISVVHLGLAMGDNLTSAAELAGPLQEQRELIRALTNSGVAVVAPAGNGYGNFEGRQGMAFPAVCPETISVGAIFDVEIPRDGDKPLATYTDGTTAFAARWKRCVPFSQRLSEEAGREHRTDVFAPGFRIVSAGAVPRPNSDEDPTRTRSIFDGTTSASAFAAGAVLLLQERARDLTEGLDADPKRLPPVDLVERCLRDGGFEVDDREDDVAKEMDNVVGSGAVYRGLDVHGAIERLQGAYGPRVRGLRAQAIKAVLEQAEREAAAATGGPAPP